MAKIWKCTYRATVAAQECLVGMHYQFDGDTGSDEPTASDVASKVDTHLRTAMLATVVAGNYLETLTVKEELVPGSTDVPEQFVLNINANGTLSSAGVGSAPTEECALMHRRTGAAVRGAKSWTFLPPPLKSASIISGKWSTSSSDFTAWAAFAAVCDDVLPFTGTIPDPSGSLNPVAYSKNRRVRALVPYTFLVTACEIDTKVRWLRSRGKGP